MKSCENCAYWDDFGDKDDAKPRQGGCRRFPPQHNGKIDIDGVFPMYQSWEFPVTGGHWWCGEFKGKSK